ncbi:hypothetical protein ACQCS2_08100, partial [Ralstonia pseudosolanacearum]
MSWLRRAAVTDAFAQAADAPALALRELRVTMGGRVLIERLSMSAAGGELAELRQRRLHLGRVRQAEADAEVV